MNHRKCIFSLPSVKQPSYRLSLAFINTEYMHTPIGCSLETGWYIAGNSFSSQVCFPLEHKRLIPIRYKRFTVSGLISYISHLSLFVALCQAHPIVLKHSQFLLRLLIRVPPGNITSRENPKHYPVPIPYSCLPPLRRCKEYFIRNAPSIAPKNPGTIFSLSSPS